MEQGKESNVRVLLVEPGAQPRPVTLPNTLEAAQKIVGGTIEVIDLEPGVCLVCSEEGKLMRPEGNRYLEDDIIVGKFFLAGDDGSGELCSLGSDAMERYARKFAQPQTFRPEEMEQCIRVEFFPLG